MHSPGIRPPSLPSQRRTLSWGAGRAACVPTVAPTGRQAHGGGLSDHLVKEGALTRLYSPGCTHQAAAREISHLGAFSNIQRQSELSNLRGGVGNAIDI